MLNVRLSNVARQRVRRLHFDVLSSTTGFNAFIPQPNSDGLRPVRSEVVPLSRPPPNEIQKTLRGCTIAVKDNICTAETATTCASKSLDGFRNPIDATVVQQLRAAGASIMEQKTNMDEFGMGSHSTNSPLGAVVNPGSDGTAFSAGGSSGGSAIAVSKGECWAALGTDTGGSIRLPAAYTGIYGFKPSYGSISRNGVVAYANSLDTVGVLANSPHDIEKVFRAVSAFDSNDPTSMTPTTRQRIACLPRDFNDLGRPLRVGIPAEYNIKELSATIRNAWNEWATKLRQEGVEIVPVSLPNTKYALSAYYVLAPAEASSNLARYDGVRFGDRGLGSDAADGTLYAKRRGELLGEEVKKRILLGTYTLSSEAMDNYFIRAQKVRKLVQRDFDRVFTQSNVLHDEKAVNQKHGVDILLCPTAPTLAPKLADLQGIPSVHAYMTDVFTVPASLAGLPAISMPYQRTDGPENNISMQIIGQYGTDDLVLNIAAKLQHSLVKDARVDQLEPVRPDQDLAEQKHDGFSPELAHKYMQMRRVYGDDMSAVQWNPAKNK